MAVYGELPEGWRLHNVSMGGEPSWVKTFEVERDEKAYNRAVQLAKKFGNAGLEAPSRWYKRKVIVAMNPFSGKWFWQTTGTQADEGKGDDMEYDDPVACAVVCEMTFGSTKAYEPVKRNEKWQDGII